MDNKKSRRGLASASQETRQRVAGQGGKAAQVSGRAHRLTNEERSRGGQNSPGNFKNRPREEVERIARKGGESSRGGGRHKSKEELKS